LLVGRSAGGALGYRNVGNRSSPSWSAHAAWNLASGASRVPAFADLDNDGDLDILMGNADGICYAYRNDGTSHSPTWVANSAWDAPDVGSSLASPALADLDGDGDYDLMIGSGGTTRAYQNTGSTTSPTWTPQASWETGLPNVITAASPAIGDRDCDGDVDMYIGSGLGVIYGVTNNGTSASPSWSYVSTLNITTGQTNVRPLLVDLNESLTWIYQTLSAGNWTNTSVWLGSSIPKASDISGEVVIEHDVTVPTGSLKILDGGVVTVNGAELTVANGTLFITGSTLAVTSGSLNVNGTVQVRAEEARFNMANSYLDIEGHLDNADGTVVFDTVCGTIGNNFENDDGIDTLNYVQLWIGNNGGGNFQNESNATLYITDSRIRAAGNFRNITGAVIKGDFDALLSDAGNLTNSATWTANIEVYCLPGGASGTASYMGSNDCADIADLFQICWQMLPVEMVSFDAVLDDGSIRLAWQTAMELNSDHYTIERSADGHSWYEVGNLPAQGNSTVLTTYSILDENPLPGISYYRLIAVDIDGTSEVVGLADVNNPTAGLTITVAPHPMAEGSQVWISHDREESVEVLVCNAMGAEVYRNIIALQAHTSVSLDFSHLTTGNYMLSWCDRERCDSRTLVVVR
jgi:hypothetical protein